jgi:hypothetical protein
MGKSEELERKARLDFSRGFAVRIHGKNPWAPGKIVRPLVKPGIHKKAIGNFGESAFYRCFLQYFLQFFDIRLTGRKNDNIIKQV